MTVLILAAAAIAICLAIGDARGLVSRGDWFLVAWVFLVGAWPFIVIYLVAPLIWSTAGAAGVYSPALQYLPGALISFVAFIQGLRAQRVEISLPAAVIGSVYLGVAVAVWFAGFTQLLNFTLAVTLFSGVLLKRGLTELNKVGVAALLSLGAIAVSIALSVAVNSGRVLADCRADKCGTTADSLTSPFAGNGNVLGMVTVLLVPFACASLPLWRTILVLGGVAGLQVLAQSRTAQFAFCVIAVVLMLMKLTSDDRWRLRFAFAGLGVGICGSIYPLFVSFSGSSFSYRGYVWEAGRDAIGRAPVFGHGPSYWYLLAQNALFDANYSPHNGWYDLMVAVGAWGVTVIVMGVVLQLFSTSRSTLPYLVVYYACVLSINTFESVYVPYFFGIIPIAALLPLMLYDPKPAKDQEMEHNLASFGRSGGE